MTDFEIKFDWEDPLGARGSELRATWSRLEIIVDGSPVTRVFDERSRTVRDAVHVPLYPLAEWLVTNWWPLWNEPRLSQPTARPGYEARHSLVGAREGYALPALLIVPAGAVLLLSWAPERLGAHRLEFIDKGGTARLETQLVREKVTSLIDAVASRLEAEGISGSLLQKEWEAIQSADPEEIEFCECAGSLGLDPYSLDEKRRREILEAADRLSESIVFEFFRAAGRTGLTAQAGEISDALLQVEKDSTELPTLKELRDIMGRRHRMPQEMPWEEGYSFAQELRAHLNLDGTPLKSIAGVARAVGTTEDDLFRVIREFPGHVHSFVGLMGINETRSPAFFLRNARPPSYLFHLCRSLFEYLCPGTDGSALITEANTERQKRNRAFAAEWLAPSAALRARVDTSEVTWEQTEEVAEDFGVSAYVIRHQLENHGIAHVQDVQDIWNSAEQNR